MRASHRALGLAALALLLVGAAPDEDPEELVRKGNAAYVRGERASNAKAAQKEFETALQFYTQAEQRTADPGLVAFNKAATLYRLGKFSDAEKCYRCCLEDGAAPTPRRLRALYDLGTSLLQGETNKDASSLRLAINCLRRCHKQTTDADLRERAGHNLELARLLLVKAASDPSNPGPKPKPDDEEPQAKKSEEPPGPENDLQPQQGKGEGKGQPLPHDPSKGEQKAVETREPSPGKGNLGTLPDTDELKTLDPRDTAAHLERAAQRIRANQREQRHSGARILPNVKDW
jgi:tetratricopeptide (TPR) repeat protein